jgi:hypothetical protein
MELCGLHLHLVSSLISLSCRLISSNSRIPIVSLFDLGEFQHPENGLD